MTITVTKAEPALIRQHNKSPLRSPTSSDLTPLALQTTMALSQWNTRYRELGWELFLKEMISNSSLCHCGTNAAQIFAADVVRCATAVCRIRRSSLSVVPRDRPEPCPFEAVLSFDHCSQQSCT
ncbi:hypothetical protein TNCV_2946121 [Trichonephila clavipes]|nr:hypothetical protein TNCV_2946121 [Trichonephila clavipes]